MRNCKRKTLLGTKFKEFERCTTIVNKEQPINGVLGCSELSVGCRANRQVLNQRQAYDYHKISCCHVFIQPCGNILIKVSQANAIEFYYITFD